MHDVSSWLFLGGIVAGCVAYWKGQFLGPAVALISAGLLLIGK
jgi:hypothetical protein